MYQLDSYFYQKSNFMIYLKLNLIETMKNWIKTFGIPGTYLHKVRKKN